MGAFQDYITSVKTSLEGVIPIGGTFVGTSEGVPMALAQQIKGGFAVLDTLDTLADIPFQILSLDMEIVVREYVLGSGTRHPRTKYILRQMPPDDTKVNEVPGYILGDYWTKVEEKNFSAETESQYAPNFEGKRPLFLPSEISSEAYQAGYPNDAAYIGGNPADIIWEDVHDPLKSHAWVRQRVVGSVSWGIPIALNAGGDYEQNQYIDTIFKWVTPKGTAAPDRPVQGTDYATTPAGWDPTPGDDYATRILTEDLYRSQAIRNPYGVLKSNWDTPLLISSDPNLVRYGNTPGITDFLNDTYWRGYYTPGLDTHQATRPDGGSDDWTISKIDQESGEFDDFVFKNFEIGISAEDLALVVPTAPYPVGGVSPNDCFDSPPAPEENKVLHMSKSTKFPDGSLKTPWSLWRRFDGLNTVQAALQVTPGDSFVYQRNASGVLEYTFSAITLAAKIYSGPTELTTGINSVKWYKGATLIVFDSITRKATNLGVSYNAYHEVSVDGKSLVINPQGFDDTQEYKVGINHVTRPSSDFIANVLLKDFTDDGSSFGADIASTQGNVFSNGAGLYEFVAKFYKGGIEDLTDVVFTWTIKDSAGAVIAGGLRNAGGVSVGEEDYAAGTVYVSGVDIDQFATLELTAVFGDVTRIDRVTLNDVIDGSSLEALYWGTGSTDPGNPTDFTPRTLTKAEVLALAIGYLEDATGAWYMIQRVDGVWGGEIKLRSESARPNGGIAFPIYKNVDFAVDGAPSAPAVPGSGSIVPAGWTQTPTAFTGSQDRQYTSVCFFLLRTDVAADATVFTRDNYTPSGSYSTPYLSGVGAPPAAVPGTPGTNGWTALLATEVRSSDGRVVHKVIDWFGGTGTKPAANTTTSYIGAAGLGTIDNATPINGLPGSTANFRPGYVNSAGSQTANAASSLQAVTGEVTMQILIVTNNFSEARSFMIYGMARFLEDDGTEVVTVTLRRKDGAFTGTWPEGSAVDVTFPTVLDYSTENIDNGLANNVFRNGHKIQVQTVETIPPGESKSYLISAQQRIGSAMYRSSAFLRAVGL